MTYPSLHNLVDPARSNLSRLLNRLPELDREDAVRIIQELEALAAQVDSLANGRINKGLPDPAVTLADEKAVVVQGAAFERLWLEAVLQALPVGVWITDPSGRVIRKNPRSDAIWGADIRPAAEEGALPRRFQYWNPETGQPVSPDEQPLAQVLAHGQAVYNVELDIQRFDGTHGTVLASAAPVWDQEGRLSGAVGVLQDITAQKQIERWLRASQTQFRESELRFQLALDNTMIVVFEMDTDLRYTWLYNGRHNFSNENVLGKRDDEILGLEESAELMAVKRQALESGQLVRKEVTYPIRGVPVTYHLTIEPLRDGQGEICGLIGTAMDLTRIRELERQQIEQRAQLEVQRRLQEQRELERQEIAREIHDGPIQSLSSAMFNLQAARESKNETDAWSMLEETASSIKETVQELRAMVNELRPPALVRFGLSRAIQMYTEDLGDRYPDLSIELDLIEDERLLPEDIVLAFYRICQESLLNAARHAQANRVEVRYFAVQDEIVLEIEDNGIGFTLPSDWVELTRSKHFGLAGMRERADVIRGQLQVRSSPGQGTTISLRLPLNRDEG